MTKAEAQAWRNAGAIARQVMGKDGLVASNDPLAWWCLTEVLYYGLEPKTKRGKHENARRNPRPNRQSQ